MTAELRMGDALELLRELPDSSVDAIITDPPYNASASGISHKGKAYRAIQEAWDQGFTPPTFLDLAWDKLTDRGSLLAFCSQHTLPAYFEWRQPKQILHWRKTNPFPALAKVHTFTTEYIVWYVKGSPYTFNKRKAGLDVIEKPICGGSEREDHPSQKPLEVVGWLIAGHTEPNHVVLDPFMGSGTTGVAAIQDGRRFIGFEIDPGYFAIARRRVSAALAQPRLLAPDGGATATT